MILENRPGKIVADRRFINSDRRVIDFVGNTHTGALFSSLQSAILNWRNRQRAGASEKGVQGRRRQAARRKGWGGGGGGGLSLAQALLGKT